MSSLGTSDRCEVDVQLANLLVQSACQQQGHGITTVAGRRSTGLRGTAVARSLRLAAATGASAYGRSRQAARCSCAPLSRRWLPCRDEVSASQLMRIHSVLTGTYIATQAVGDKPQVTLQGHSGHLQAVCWDPSHDDKVASAADHTVRCGPVPSSVARCWGLLWSLSDKACNTVCSDIMHLAEPIPTEAYICVYIYILQSGSAVRMAQTSTLLLVNLCKNKDRDRQAVGCTVGQAGARDRLPKRA